MTAASEEVKQTTKLQDVPHDLSDRTMNHIANLLVGDVGGGQEARKTPS